MPNCHRARSRASTPVTIACACRGRGPASVTLRGDLGPSAGSLDRVGESRWEVVTSGGTDQVSTADDADDAVVQDHGQALQGSAAEELGDLEQWLVGRDAPDRGAHGVPHE